ncbi:zinc ribbon domain-containing protein [Streptomyces sp. NPDC127117]|uniref:zinc ribbon domain-containing protein n=1 Tax=Streptomyces sp. NPDC127117 TaxID=3345368 RepID=UPI003641732D
MKPRPDGTPAVSSDRGGRTRGCGGAVPAHGQNDPPPPGRWQVPDAKSRRTRSLFTCTHCGHTNHADTGAAVNIMSRATAAFSGERRAIRGRRPR